LGEAHLRRILTKYAAYYNELGLIGLLAKTLRSIAPSSTQAASHLCLSSADFIIITVESNFRYRHPVPIADQVARGFRPRECLCDVACNPFRGRTWRDVDPDKVSALQSNDDEDIEPHTFIAG
jgi:hypothetical protein